VESQVRQKPLKLMVRLHPVLASRVWSFLNRELQAVGFLQDVGDVNDCIGVGPARP